MLTEYGSWKVVGEIGSGSYGTVYELEREEFGNVYRAALKVINIPKDNNELEEIRSQGMADNESLREFFADVVEDVVKEIKLMAKLQGHTNIVSYQDHQVVPFEDGIGWTIYIQMELLTSLTRHLKDNKNKIKPQEVIRIGIDICNALERCQKFNIIHRDIKPDNIFVSQFGDYKLGDFGIARTTERTISEMSQKGTPTYMAPEVVKEMPYGSSVDMYSLGIVMYRLLNDNRPPFYPDYPQKIRSKDQMIAHNRRMSGDPLPLPRHNKDRLGEIIVKACSYRVEDRYSSPKQMREDLEALLLSDRDRYILPEEPSISIHSNSGHITGHQIPSDTSVMSTNSDSQKGIPSEVQINMPAPSMNDDHTEAVTERPFLTDSTKEDGTVKIVGTQPSVQSTDSDLDRTQGIWTEKQVKPEHLKSENSIEDNIRKDKNNLTDEKKRIPYDTSRNQNKNKRSPVIAGVLLLGCILCFVIYLLIPKGPKMVPVPDVLGQVQEDAATILQEKSLHLVVGEPIYSYDYPEGQIAAIEEMGEEVEEGSDIVVHISLGSLIIIDNYIGKKGEDAEIMLLKEQLSVTEEDQYSDDIPEGQILAQSITTGREVEPGTEILLTISAGPEPFELADYTNALQEDVVKELETLGITVEISKKYHATIPKGNVIGSKPKAGKKIRKGDSITLNISKGIRQVKVPSVIGMAAEEAEKILTDAGFKVIFGDNQYDDSIASGKIKSQSVAADSMIDEGSEIKLVKSVGKKPVQTYNNNNNNKNNYKPSPKPNPPSDGGGYTSPPDEGYYD